MNYDVHWRPMIYLCSPCNIHYNATLKLEYLERELKCFTQKYGWNTELTNNPAKERQNEGARHNLTARQITDLYFETLDDEDIKKLYYIFKDDFKLYGYEPHQLCYRLKSEFTSICNNSLS